ncbi:aminotransferase class I/II-fold pyridoxal phosphate-dependent enzyme [Macrococcus lamae]|uniref:Aminotransferase class I/II-fold pyridoxal phosphate-dependent enzyme n=1 Tax=Macrococcus lamae TaxID=198484 RepID=A0A4R6BSN2_9STAP|nr:aminotransferase class I/II-fold pyridoxal phosphate-dependent enzyme [Macrococcus lamae]TDM05193.1 aminotransferase class I/II-fold pyridoxal phosphate-dependent enzyme [Macrococcus lamae]
MNKRLHLSIAHMGNNEQKYVQEAFDQNWVAPLGPNVDKFEEVVAEYSERKAAAALSSGTSGLHLALKLLDVQQGDAVFCSSLTFIASANPIVYEKATPVFIDSERDTWNMSPLALERALKEAAEAGQLPKAVIIVNLYGQVAKMDELIALCDSYDVPVIEDSAESLGSLYKGRKSGSFGKFSVFSFNGNKIITTSGGGMLLADDEELIKKARFLSTQARDAALHYQHSEIGYNYRMSNVCAGIGRGQMEVLEDRVKRRREIFDMYARELKDVKGISLMPELEGTKSNRWLTAMTIDSELTHVTPVELIEKLAEDNIESRPVWKPLHLQPVFEGTKFYPHDEDVAKYLFENGICLPSASIMTDEDVIFVCERVKAVLSVEHVNQ